MTSDSAKPTLLNSVKKILQFLGILVVFMVLDRVYTWAFVTEQDVWLDSHGHYVLASDNGLLTVKEFTWSNEEDAIPSSVTLHNDTGEIRQLAISDYLAQAISPESKLFNSAHEVSTRRELSNNHFIEIVIICVFIPVFFAVILYLFITRRKRETS